MVQSFIAAKYRHILCIVWCSSHNSCEDHFNDQFQITARVQITAHGGASVTASVVAAFVDDLSAHGINVSPADIVADGSLHRVHVDGDRARSENLVYKIHDDDQPSWWFEDHKRGVTATGTLKTDRPAASSEDRSRWADQKRQREQAVTARHVERAAYCADLFTRAKPAPADHPYLSAKRLQPTPGIRYGSVRRSTFFDNPALDGVLAGALLIPIRDASGIRSMQAILPGGDKFYTSGGAKQGCWHQIPGRDRSTVLLCEGYATGNALAAATGFSVVCAMDAGNLMAVADALCVPLADRRVIVCGDNDHRTDGNPGLTAATAVGERFGWQVRCPEFDRGATGTDWDDWLRDAGGSADRLRDILEHGYGEAAAPDPVDDGDQRPEPPEPGEPVSGELTTADTMRSWEQLGLTLNGNGIPDPNLDNVCRILSRHDELRGRVWYDEFLQRMVTSWPAGGAVEWTDHHDSLLTLFLQRTMGLKLIKTLTVAQAVTAVAMSNPRNELTEYLNGLAWDGSGRLERFMPVAFGAGDTPYTQAVGRCWMVSMVARALDPGCKVDTLPVFEGAQGLQKSTAMQTLVGTRWFAEASESPTSKDFYQVLTGKLLVEIAELDAFNRTEVNTIKRVVSCRIDRYRAPYGRRADDHPRMCVFAGTTNRDDWNRDETGARRFWPVHCTSIDIGWIRANRDQLFAEAVALYRAGRSWWDVPAEEAKTQQEARRQEDVWEGIIDHYLLGRDEITVGEILIGCLKVEESKMEKAHQMRVASVLRVLGWERKTVWRGDKTLKVWVKGGKGGNDDPF